MDNVINTVPAAEQEPVTPQEPQVPVTPQESVEPVFKGRIRNCTKLNVRADANPNARILCVIGKDDEVEIDRKNSTDEFWKVNLESGVEGYCMKKFMKMVRL